MTDAVATNRAQFLTVSSVGLGAVIAGVIGVPATAYILAPVVHEVDFEGVYLGQVDSFTSEKGFEPTAATYVENSKQVATSGGLAYVHHTGKSGTTWNAPDAQFIVFSNRCMHLGCPIAAIPSVGFQCPCHGGAYNELGQRTAGPPIRPLDRFQWEIRKGKELWITQRWSVDFNSDGSIHYYQVKNPGQPVTLPVFGTQGAEILYPTVTYKYPSNDNPNNH